MQVARVTLGLAEYCIRFTPEKPRPDADVYGNAEHQVIEVGPSATAAAICAVLKRLEAYEIPPQPTARFRATPRRP